MALELQIDGQAYQSPGPDLLAELLASIESEEHAEIWLAEAEGPSICLLKSGPLAMLMYLSAPGDSGLTSRAHRVVEPERMLKFRLANGQVDEYALAWAPPVLERIFSTDQVQVSRLILAPGEEVPWHFHSDVRDTFYVLRGPVTICTRDPEATIVIDTGEVLQTRERQPHRVVNVSDHEVSFVLIQGVGKFDFQPRTRRSRAARALAY